MAYEGQELEAPNGGRLRFVRITGNLLEMEARFSGLGPLPPPHLHPYQDERFQVLDGAVRAVIAGQQRRYVAGEAFQVPAGTVHQMGGDGRARVHWEVRPALRFAECAEALYSGAAAADPGAFLARYADEMRLVAPPPYVHDLARWGASMAHHSELMLACFDAVGARSVVEVGAHAGDLTTVLIDWAQRAGARITAVDPSPQPDLVALAERAASVLDLVRDTSLEAIPKLAPADVIIIDGDHNYYTVTRELELIAERVDAAGPGRLPLLLFHDVCWPHARRDDYFDLAQIPPDYRHDLVGEGMGIHPEDPGTRADGLPYPRSAAREGGPHNGVQTAVEDFVAGRADLRLVVVPAFFGFGAVWPLGAPWAERVASILGPYDRHPLLERLEANRVLHIAGEHALRVASWKAQERVARQEQVLWRMLESSAVGVAERAEIRRALDDG